MPEADDLPNLDYVIEKNSTEENPVTIGMGVFERVIGANTPYEGKVALHTFVNQLISNTPEVQKRDTTELIHRVLPPIFGPFWGEPAYQEKLNYRQVVESARMQQQYVHLIYAASLLNANPNLTETVYNMVKSFDRASTFPGGDKRDQKAWMQFTQWWNGVRAQLAILNTFKRKKIPESVYLPNYEGGNEVELWDVRGKVDMAVVRDSTRTSLCLDAKSNYSLEEAFVPFFGEIPKEQLDRLDSNLQKILRGSSGDYRVMRGEIVIPTAQLSWLKDVNTVFDKGGALDSYGNLHEDDERTILTAIDKSLQRRR